MRQWWLWWIVDGKCPGQGQGSHETYTSWRSRTGRSEPVEPVDSMAHKKVNDLVNLLEISVDRMKDPLQISKEHFLYVGREGELKMALDVKVGDELSLLMDYEFMSTTKVNKIQSVQRKGFYAPYTYSGNIVVNGVKLSVFAAFHQQTDQFSLAGLQLPVHSHTALWVLTAHHRVLCMVNFAICENENHSNEDGVSNLLLPTHDF